MKTLIKNADIYLESSIIAAGFIVVNGNKIESIPKIKCIDCYWPKALIKEIIKIEKESLCFLQRGRKPELFLYFGLFLLLFKILKLLLAKVRM